MTRLELARMRFQQLAPELTLGADESRSDQLESWLRDEVVPVVEDLCDNPVFRRQVLHFLEQFFATPATAVRAEVSALADALVADAQAMTSAAREFGVLAALADHDRAHDETWLAESTFPVDPRSVIEKIADRPWFDLVTAEDFWTPGAHLYLRSSDSLLTRQFRRDHGQPELLGDHVVKQLFARLEFWKGRLDRGRQRLQGRLPTGSGAAYAAEQRMFNCVLDVEQKYQALKQAWHQGAGPRLRSACLTLLQTYVAYHESPTLPWSGFDAQSLSVNGRIIRSFFRHRGTLTLVNQQSDGRLEVVDERQASLVDVGMIRRVAASLEDIAALYHRGVHPDDLIAEAKDQCKLLVVVQPRMVFWQGQLLELDWDGAEKAWNLILHLAVKTEGRLPLHDFVLTGVTTSRHLSVRKSHLQELLSRSDAGAAVAVLIEKVRGGDCVLNLGPAEIKVLDLDADEWTADASGFLHANL